MDENTENVLNGKISSRSDVAFKSNISAFEDGTDGDISGKMKVLMKNDRNSMFKMNISDRIARVIVVKIHQRKWMRIVQHSESPPTKHGSGCF